MSRRIPPETSAKVRELYNDAEFSKFFGNRPTVAELARSFNISQPSVRRILDGSKPPPSDAPLSVSEVARLLRVSPGKVRTWIRSGAMAASNVGTTRPRFVITRDALNAFLKAREPEPAKPRRKKFKRRPDDRY